MIIFVAVSTIVTILAIMWARNLAYKRGRHASGWMLATAFFPPIVLILWALPARRLTSQA